MNEKLNKGSQNLHASYEEIKQKSGNSNNTIKPSLFTPGSAFDNGGFVKLDGDETNERYKSLKDRITLHRQTSASSDVYMPNMGPNVSPILFSQMSLFGNYQKFKGDNLFEDNNEAFNFT